jgi:hypothetical protein
MKELFSSGDFNIKITSFNDAKNDLDKLTGQQWHVIEQAGTEVFQSVPFEEKLIHFSAYGRRLPAWHAVLMDFCKENNLYYDYSTHGGRYPTADPEQLYRQYAWHLNHSLFTLSWPVELTNPERAGHLHPITCRWFEAACAGSVILGRKPANEVFDQWLFPDLVIALDPKASQNEIRQQLENIWKNRKELYSAVNEKQNRYYGRLTWDNRVQRILELLKHN